MYNNSNSLLLIMVILFVYLNLNFNMPKYKSNTFLGTRLVRKDFLHSLSSSSGELMLVTIVTWLAMFLIVSS